jgi:hypothetical protein
VRRSASYLRQTWGEQIAGNLGIGVVFGQIGFGTLVAGVALFMAVYRYAAEGQTGTFFTPTMVKNAFRAK